MKDLCLFDLDGTIIDPKEGITKSLKYALDHFGIQIASLDELEKFIGPPLRDVFSKHFNFSPDETERAVEKYREYFSETGIYKNTVYPGIIQLLKQLKHNKAVLAIATSKPTVFAEKIAGHFGFSNYFDIIAGSELDGTRSRKSEVINYVLNVLDPKRTKSSVMIGDRKYDIIGAKEAGIDSIGITWGYGPPEELSDAHATRMAGSPVELGHILLGKVMR